MPQAAEQCLQAQPGLAAPVCLFVYFLFIFSEYRIPLVYPGPALNFSIRECLNLCSEGQAVLTGFPVMLLTLSLVCFNLVKMWHVLLMDQLHSCGDFTCFA